MVKTNLTIERFTNFLANAEAKADSILIHLLCLLKLSENLKQLILVLF